MDDVTALNLASHQFRNVWLSNTGSISAAVLSRTIESYDYACELVKIQQKFFERDHGDDNGHHDPYLQALERNKLIKSNLNNFFELQKVEFGFNCPLGTQLLELISSKIYYCICMLVFTEGDKSAQSSCLASLDLSTLEFMYDFVEWYNDEVFVEPNVTGVWEFVPLWFGLEEIGGEFPEVTLMNIQHRLGKACLDVWKARQVGNSAKSA